MSDLTDHIRHDVAVLDLVREHLAGRHNETAHETCLCCDYTEIYSAYGQACAERDEVTGERDDALLMLADLTGTEARGMTGAFPAGGTEAKS